MIAITKTAFLVLIRARKCIIVHLLVTQYWQAMHPDMRTVATGQVGKNPDVVVWDSVECKEIQRISQGWEATEEDEVKQCHCYIHFLGSQHVCLICVSDVAVVQYTI
jgi:hypothetical protein